MSQTFKLPFLGENITSAGVVKVLVHVGDVVTAEQPVLEVETDKAAIEVPSSIGGKVTKIHVKEGEKVAVGGIVFEVEQTGAEGDSTRSADSAASASTAAQSSAPSVQAASPAPPSAPTPAPAISQKQAPASQPAPVTAIPSPPAASGPRQPEGLRETAPASPSVRRLAREIGVDIMQVPGSGTGGRITEEDVKTFARRVNTDVGGFVTMTSSAPGAPVPLPDFSKWGTVDRKAMSSVRRKTAEHMTNAWSTIPHVTQFDKADMTELEQLRQRFGKKAEASGGKLTVTAIIIKVISSALKVFPQFNASVDMATSEIVYKKFYHIGVAVDTDRGLLVPVIRDVDKKNILEISAELNAVAEKARNKKTTLEEMQGGTFTITNLGGIGGTNFTPIVNSPEVAILGVARSSIEPVYLNGKFEPRMMLPLALSYDHRLIDGADGARFLRWVVDALQQPFLMSLEG